MTKLGVAKMDKPHESAAPQGEARGSSLSLNRETLGRVKLLSSLTPDALAHLTSFGWMQQVAPRSQIVIEGELSRGLYIILKGVVSIYRTDPVSGSLMRLSTLEAGQYFGELSLFEASPRSATVTAETQTLVYNLDAEQFDQFLKWGGDSIKLRFFKACAEELATRFRSLNQEYMHAQQLLWKYALRRADGSLDKKKG